MSCNILREILTVIFQGERQIMTTRFAPACGNADTTKSNSSRTRNAPVQTSRLLLLPAELRNKIFRYVFQSSTYSYMRRNPGESGARVVLQPGAQGRKHHHIALLLVCRSVRFETKALPLLLGTVKFNSLSTLSRFLGQDEHTDPAMGPPVEKITNVHLQAWDTDGTGMSELMTLVMNMRIDFTDFFPNAKHLVLEIFTTEPIPELKIQRPTLQKVRSSWGFLWSFYSYSIWPTMMIRCFEEWIKDEDGVELEVRVVDGQKRVFGR
ncbi:hypothetical protein BDU57DRAFT_598017 [Ampelomyces quisqualis]|uniref:F-box domain-containing protein n=1 Tax=Ampelomyces quisqualis TaxID=50730 RepID=A0A6A5QCI1_AMPQU|nr:hypothetical protein BDU57DRAFT_598017 [Ampelomyces quisqualis]